MKLGVNTVLLGGHSFEDAFRVASLAGYDGVEISAIPGMGEHLALDEWKDRVGDLLELSTKYGLELLAMEQPVPDPARMEVAFQAAYELRIPVVNCGPGGKVGDDRAELLQTMAESGKQHGITLCVKAHVGQSIHDTRTTLAALERAPDVGLDMDPSHIHRAGEDVVDALKAVVHRIRHVHIRDCAGPGPSPGTPSMQANGRGDIDLGGFLKALHDFGYSGPVDLEVIGAKDLGLVECAVIAAEARGHMQACLQACGAR